MPHQDYIQRPRKEMGHPPSNPGSGVRPLTNRPRGQAEVVHQPRRSSPRLGNVTDKTPNKNQGSTSSRGDKPKQKLSAVAVKALDALENDSENSELSSVGDGGHPSHSHQMIDTSCATSTSTPPLSPTRGLSPLRQGQRQGDAWKAVLKQKMQIPGDTNNASRAASTPLSTPTKRVSSPPRPRQGQRSDNAENKILRKMRVAMGRDLGLGSPAGSVASRSQHSIASSRNTCSAVTNVFVASRSNPGSRAAVTNNNSIPRGTRVAVSHNVDHPPTKMEMMSNERPRNGQGTARGNVQGAVSSNKNGVIDLTDLIDLTSDVSSENRQPISQVESNQTVQGNDLAQISNKQGKVENNRTVLVQIDSGENDRPSIAQVENNQTVQGNDLAQTSNKQGEVENNRMVLVQIDPGENDRQPIAQVENNQTVQGNDLAQTSNKQGEVENNRMVLVQILDKPKGTEKKSSATSNELKRNELPDEINKIVTERAGDRTINQETANSAPKPSGTTRNGSNNGGEQPMPPATPNNANVNQPVHLSSKQQCNKKTGSVLNGNQTVHPSNKPLSHEKTCALKPPTKSHHKSAGSKKSTGAATKRKSNNPACRKSPKTKRAPAEKPKPSCSLHGKLSCTERDGTFSHIICGYWQYENQSGATPQRFEFLRDIPPDEESMSLTKDGIFQGSFAYQWALTKGEPPKILVITEKEVNLSFTEQQQDGDELQLFNVHGTGENEVGKFDLVGTASKTPDVDYYTLKLQKKYTELFPSRVSQPDPDGDSDKCGKKRKLSMLDTSSGSNESSDQGKKPPAREFARAITLSPEESKASNESDDVDMFDEVAGNNEEDETLKGGKTVYDVTQSVTMKKREEKYDPVSNLLSQSSAAFDEIDSRRTHGSWKEFGDLQHMDPSISARRTLSWNVRNVEPSYNRVTLEFFSSTGIVNVQDLLEANTDNLCSHLMAHGDFKTACAFATWRKRLNRHKDSNYENQVTSFHDLYCPEHAKQSILTWKQAAESWYKEVAGTDFIDGTRTNDHEEVEVAFEMEVEGSSEAEEENSYDFDQVPLKNVLGSYGASILNKHCKISTAHQLLAADGEDMIRRLSGVVFQGRDGKDVRLLIEGMLHAWSQDAQEALQADSPITDTPPPAPLAEAGAGVGVPDSSRPAPSESRPAFQTPLSYADLRFLRSHNISSDEKLANVDPSLLSHGYVTYLRKTYHEQVSIAEALEATEKWRQGAKLVLGLRSTQDICDTLPQNTRLLKDSGQLDIMHTEPNLSKTVADEKNDGLPRRTIFTNYNDVLYEFDVSVKDSMVDDDAGKGAFLTYKGAKVLRASSRQKEKGRIPHKPTRKPLDASFALSGATVTLKGKGLHGDEHHYGPEDGVGLHREFTLDDFVDTKDNITFSSRHVGCGLVELESRYAPLLKEDRKTDKVFSVKDFLFSNEPSSWRFDVEEELNGHPQVVDFTDDTTGAPHDVAKSHMSMYVNEVGHNMDLVENVEALSPTPRSVTYYIHIDKPMTKGEMVELLVNYKDGYESMRVRRGYGKANLCDGAKSDADDITRVQRNLEDRFLIEASLKKFTENEISQVLDFFKDRVWDGLKEATTTFATSCKEDETNLLRQCIARRRITWIAEILSSRFHELLGRRGIESLPFLGSSDDGDFIFQTGMPVFVHDWPQNDKRPPYTGLATIESISKDEHKRHVFEVYLPDNKWIESVPEAVVTLPTDDDFKGAPKRTYSNWMKWKKEQELPRSRLRMLRGIELFKKWDWDIYAGSASASSPEMKSKILQSLRWELSEELIFVLTSNSRLTRPLDEKVWCSISVSLFTNCLHLIAESLLIGVEKHTIFKRLMGLARDAAKTIKDIVNGSANASINQVAFDSQERIPVLVVDAIHINRIPVEVYLKEPMPLDLEWYLIHQIVLAVHPLASLIDWGPSSGTNEPLYSIEKLCDNIGLAADSSYLNFYTSKVQEWRPHYKNLHH